MLGRSEGFVPLDICELYLAALPEEFSPQNGIIIIIIVIG